MKNIVLLDLDGVLITTPSWKADSLHADGYSDFNPGTVNNLNELLLSAKADTWLSSSRRSTKTLKEFNTLFKNRNISTEIKGFISEGASGISRLQKINSFLDAYDNINFLILDDDNSLEDLSPERKCFWVKTLPLIGFNGAHLSDALLKIKSWKY